MKNLLRRYQDCVERFWSNIGRWFSYYKVLRKVYDFDYTSILEVEKHQIERVRDSIKHFHNVEKLNLAIRILDIILEDGCAEMNGSQWSIPVYVNTRNYKRFYNFEITYDNSPRFIDLWKDALRLQKAWYLYHKLRYNYLKQWWD